MSFHDNVGSSDHNNIYNYSKSVSQVVENKPDLVLTQIRESAITYLFWYKYMYIIKYTDSRTM